MSTKKIRAALLIDADNLPTAQVAEALEKLEAVCNPIIRKAFGDFTNSAKNWNAEFLLEFRITPIQHFPVSNYKNGADIAMCIEAMDVLHLHTVDAIVLFSSDSDFGSVASRIREAGIEVIGVGDKQTNERFRACFDKFIIVNSPAVQAPQETIRKTTKPKEGQKKLATKPSSTQSPPAKGKRRSQAEAERVIRFEIENCQSDDGWVKMSELGSRLRARSPRFVISHYGSATLGKLLEKISGFITQPKHKPPRVKVDPSMILPKDR